MNVNEFSQLILSLSLSFAILAIGFQLARVFGNLNGVMKDAKEMTSTSKELVKSLQRDYNFIAEIAMRLVNSLDRVIANFLSPVNRISEVWNSRLGKLISRFLDR